MKYGPRKTAELLERAKVIRTEEKLTWREIARRIGVSLPWLNTHKHKLGDVTAGRIHAIPNLKETLAKVKTMRDQKTPWETIEATLGIDWQILRRAASYYNQD